MMSDYFFLLFFIGTLFVASPFLGRYIARIFDRKENGKFEAVLYKMLGIDTGLQV